MHVRPPFIAALVAAALATGAGACGGNEETAGTSAVSASVSDIIDNPSACLDQVVAIQGIVREIVGPREFTVSGTERPDAGQTSGQGDAGTQDADQAPAVTDQVLVLATTKLPDAMGQASGRGPITRGDVVQVEGRVKALDDLRGNLESGGARGVSFSGAPTVVATEISPAGESPEDIAEGDDGDTSPCAASSQTSNGGGGS